MLKFPYMAVVDLWPGPLKAVDHWSLFRYGV